MKKRQIKLGQYLHEDIECLEDEKEYLANAISLIGQIVVTFSGLENSLNMLLRHIFTDRSDSFGVLVLHKMPFYARVELFERLSDDIHSAFNNEPSAYSGLIAKLKEAGKLRNLVVHAEWEDTYDGGFTHVSVQVKKGKITQEYVQFSTESLQGIIKSIDKTRTQLDNYWEARDALFST